MNTTTTRRMTCIACDGELTHPTTTICLACSDALRTGKPIAKTRTYCLPECVTITVKFRMKGYFVQWKFPEDRTYADCANATLTPEPTHSTYCDACDDYHTPDYERCVKEEPCAPPFALSSSRKTSGSVFTGTAAQTDSTSGSAFCRCSPSTSFDDDALEFDDDMLYADEDEWQEYWKQFQRRTDEVAHCTSCEDNPATEGDDLCLPCAQLRDAQPVRQENDASWGNRGGCSWSEPAWELVRNDDKANDFFDNQDDAEAYARINDDASWTLYRYIDGRKTYVKQFIATDITALYQRLDDGYRKQAFFARASALALALTMALGIGSASAAETLTYTSPTSGRTLTLPFIGTPAYSDSCTITHAWEDGSALASCWEDGATYAYDADGKFFTDHGIVFHYGEPGWYVAEGGAS